ncbi:hypothetical protein VNO78_05368 [Psophocarpus tetragonolobus]|uniref:Plastid division protein PDV2 n=1 Tax=Psophocarpus tetragonolobus TaxID=3891 RepID=A0AAN9STK9_PSOTE
MEEEEGIGLGLVLARATELGWKISNCIYRARASANGPSSHTTERLLSICDALDALQTKLSSLQVLQQQQLYEREIALAEIESSRKMLIDKLKEYKGKGLEVIHEASTFASETLELNNDLLLPLYHSRSPYPVYIDKEFLSQIPSVNKSGRNGLITLDPVMEEKDQNHVENGAKSSRKALGFLITYAVKTMLMVVGVVSILTLPGFAPKLGTHFSVQGWLDRVENEERSTTKNQDERSNIHCPPGRILVWENEEARCLVKERVQIPFSAVAATPDINYGCG